MRNRTDIDKAIEVLLYVTTEVTDVYKALKILYFADKEHLGKYGRLIYGDTYVALQHGPVPSAAYDIVKAVRGDGWVCVPLPANEVFEVNGNTIKPLRRPDLTRISESDRECLDAAIAECRYLSFSQLKDRSHDAAYLQADQNDIMSLEQIAGTLPDAEMLLEYLSNGG